MEPIRYTAVCSIIEQIYVIIDWICVGIAFSQVLLYNKNLEDRKKKSAIKIFTALHVANHVVFYVIFLTLQDNDLVFTISAIYSHLSDLIPLLYLQFFLNRHYRLPLGIPVREAQLERFFTEYKISKREGEIVQLICQGKSNKEIGETIFVSIQTVKGHIYNIFQKTGVKSRIQLANLVREAIR